MVPAQTRRVGFFFLVGSRARTSLALAKLFPEEGLR
jgi:hypothetical protein